MFWISNTKNSNSTIEGRSLG